MKNNILLVLCLTPKNPEPLKLVVEDMVEQYVVSKWDKVIVRIVNPNDDSRIKTKLLTVTQDIGQVLAFIDTAMILRPECRVDLTGKIAKCLGVALIKVNVTETSDIPAALQKNFG